MKGYRIRELTTIEKTCLACTLPDCKDVHHHGCPIHHVSPQRPTSPTVTLQGRILELLEREPMTVYELIDHTGAKQTSISNAMYKLFGKGQVTREKIVHPTVILPNRRKVFLYRRST